MRKLLTFFILITILFILSMASGCTVIASLKPKEYRCTISGEPDPVTAEDYYLRAINHAELSGTNVSGDFDECAMAALNDALRIDPNHVKSLRMRGYGYRQKKKYDLALADIEKAIQIEPNHSSSYAVRGGIFEMRGQIDKAIADQTKANELTPKDSPELHYYFARRGEFYYKKDDYQASVEDYTEAIRLKPDYKYHYSDRARVYRQMGKIELAAADEQKAEGNNSVSTSNNSDSGKTISGGVVNSKAVNLVKPPYPPAAKAVRASGAVNVQVTIDENGNVISASAVSGHPLLKAAAEAAAKASKFTPTMLNGKAVKVSGVVVFNFNPE